LQIQKRSLQRESLSIKKRPYYNNTFAYRKKAIIPIIKKENYSKEIK
jgi:hypothetical protein